MGTRERRQIHILHVDDEPGFADMAATFLQRQDDRFTVKTATSPGEALDQLTDTTYDCIVSDYDMPGQDGIEFLKTVRKDSPNLPFILFTGKGSETVASKAIAAGVTDYLQKDSGQEQYELLANRINNAVARHSAERRATKSEERYATLFENLGEPAVEVSFDGTTAVVETVNENFETVFGIDESAIAGDALDAHIVPEDDHATARELNQLTRAGESAERELRRETEDGFRWFLLRTVPFTVGREVRAYAIYLDITERKQQQERFRAFLKHSTDITTVLSPAGTHQYQSPSSEQIVGYEPAELLGESVFEYIHPDDRAEVQETYQEAIKNPEITPTTEFRYQHKDGSWRWLESIGNNQLNNPAIEGFIVNSRDITERKEREQELQQIRDRMEFALKATDAVVWDWNVEADEATFIPSEESLYGTSVQTRDEFLEVVHPEDRQEVREALEYSLETGNLKREEVRVVQDGAVRWIEAPGKPVSYDGTTHLLGVVRDVTDRKEKGREIQRQNERLEQFASIVSHDLRNPLNVASGELELARHECDSDHLEKVVRAHDRMETLIDNLLTLAREGEQVNELDSVTLTDTIERCWQTVETADAKLVTETAQTVRADPSRVKQLFENLIRNAVEHGGEDVTITIGDLDGRDGFYVADDGSGIPENKRERIFEIGYSTTGEGTGFGLNIVAEIAEAHEWDIQVTDSETGGTRFEITDIDIADE